MQGLSFISGIRLRRLLRSWNTWPRPCRPREAGSMQMEDEIASIGAVLGSFFAGQRAMTATSGPGFALMTELITHGVMSETPCGDHQCPERGTGHRASRRKQNNPIFRRRCSAGREILRESSLRRPMSWSATECTVEKLSACGEVSDAGHRAYAISF